MDDYADFTVTYEPDYQSGFDFGSSYDFSPSDFTFGGDIYSDYGFDPGAVDWSSAFGLSPQVSSDGWDFGPGNWYDSNFEPYSADMALMLDINNMGREAMLDQLRSQGLTEDQIANVMAGNTAGGVSPYSGESLGESIGYDFSSPEQDRAMAAQREALPGALKAAAANKSIQERLAAVSQKAVENYVKQQEAKQKFADSGLGKAAAAANAAGLVYQALAGKNKGSAPVKTSARSSTVEDTGPKASGTRAIKTQYASGGAVELPQNVKGGLLPVSLNIAKRLVRGKDGGQDDTIDARLSPGEYIIDAEVVSALGDGNTEAGAKKLDKMRYNVRKHKRSGGLAQIAAKSKEPEEYLKG